MLRDQDRPIWQQALPYLDVRDNDAHTLFSYVWGQQLLKENPEADADLVLPAILLHDTGWKQIPADKVLQAFGPNKKYPELQRQHELESVAIARAVLPGLGYPAEQVDGIVALIDGHDTTAEGRSREDALMKDADKLWRYTPHGMATIQRWFDLSRAEVLDILTDFVLPKLLTEAARHWAQHRLAIARMEEALPLWLATEPEPSNSST